MQMKCTEWTWIQSAPLWQSVLIMTRQINGELQQGSFTILM